MRPGGPRVHTGCQGRRSYSGKKRWTEVETSARQRNSTPQGKPEWPCRDMAGMERRWKSLMRTGSTMQECQGPSASCQVSELSPALKFYSRKVRYENSFATRAITTSGQTLLPSQSKVTWQRKVLSGNRLPELTAGHPKICNYYSKSWGCYSLHDSYSTWHKFPRTREEPNRPA